jgi:ATP-binding cassette, subfamily B, bacterial HlyB/CyaB
MAHALEGGMATAMPVVQGTQGVADSAISALGALCIVARLHQVAAEPANLAHQLAWSSDHVPSANDLVLAARHLGLKARLARPAADRLAMSPLPALVMIRGPSGEATASVLAQCDGQRVLLAGTDATAVPQIRSMEDFLSSWTGELILIASRASIAGDLARFDFSWFIPSIVRHRKLLGEVLLVSMFLQVLALVTPLFFQVVMDKVLVHKGYTTLDVLAAGLLAAMLFESVLSVLRGYIFSHTTSRIDVELAASCSVT